MSEKIRVARRPETKAPILRTNEKTGLHCGAKTMSVVFSSTEGKSIRGEEAESGILFSTKFYPPLCSHSRNFFFQFSSHQTVLPPTKETETAPSDSLNPRSL